MVSSGFVPAMVLNARPIAGKPAQGGVCESRIRMTLQGSSRGQLRFLGFGACALAGTLWGTGFYFGRIALDAMNVEPMVLYRFLFACLGITPAILGSRERLTAGEWRTVLMTAAFGIPIQFLLQFHGLGISSLA